MLHNYEKLIVESEEELSKLEREHRHNVIGRRVSMLRELKSKEVRSIATVAEQLNYSVRQCQRWFKNYQEEGLAAILKNSEQGKSSRERMTEEAWSALEQWLEQVLKLKFTYPFKVICVCDTISYQLDYLNIKYTRI